MINVCGLVILSIIVGCSAFQFPQTASGRYESNVNYRINLITSHNRYRIFRCERNLPLQLVTSKEPHDDIDTKVPTPAIQLPMTNSSDANVELGLQQLQYFLKIAVPYFQTDDEARKSLASVVALTLASSGISVVFSYISRDFYNALNAQDVDLFYEKIKLFFIAICVTVPIQVFYRYTREQLSLFWREKLTRRVLDDYLSQRTFYIMETLKDIDNPDQRISEDIRSFTRTSVDFFITIFTSVIDLLSFSAILFQIYPPLFYAIIVYAGAGSFVTSKIGQSLIKLNYDKLQAEANFRFSLIRSRENSEAIAFYDCNATLEKSLLVKLFESVKLNQLDIITTQRNLEGFTTAYRYLPNILPSLIVAPLFFSHKVEFGAISQSYSAFNHVLSDFSIIINQFESLSAFAAGLSRLTSFLDRVAQKGWSASSTTDSLGNYMDWNGELVQIEMLTRSADEFEVLSVTNLDVLTPDRSRWLLGHIPLDNPSNSYRGVNFSIHKGDRVLIVGASGTGKSSLLRVIAGLWSIGRGEVSWRFTNSTADTTKNVFFLPQKPYNILGSLSDQIQYPQLLSIEGSSSGRLHDDEDSKMIQILHKVNLGHICNRVSSIGDAVDGLRNVRVDWSKVLSLGEQQRLAFARVLYHSPEVVVLDESTSALDAASEEVMYSLLQELNCTVISVGHRSTLNAFHTKKLVLSGPGIDISIDNL